MKEFHLHLVSDSTGETVSSVARAAVAQFEDIEPEEHIWSLVRTPHQLEKVINGIKENPGVVMFTVVNKELSDSLKLFCHQQDLPCIPILSRAVSELAAYLGIPISQQPGRQYELTEDYFSRVEAINFTLAHDDGQSTWDLEDADMVVIGASRTSKSPTCVYLANRGYKAANVPFVSNCPLPENLFTLKKPLVVGLVIDPDRLMQIRESRLQSIQGDSNSSYVERDNIIEEIQESRKLFSKYRWPVIDVTRRSVEETAANIIQHFSRHQELRLKHGRKDG